MGTNYYWTENPCPHCGRGDNQLHIGKKSAGWRFSLRAHSDHQPPLRSWAAWKLALAAGVVRNEYDEPLPADVFVAMVEASRDEKRNHIPYCLNGREQDQLYIHAQMARGDAWQDEEGWSFGEGEFS